MPAVAPGCGPTGRMTALLGYVKRFGGTQHHGGLTDRTHPIPPRQSSPRGRFPAGSRPSTTSGIGSCTSSRSSLSCAGGSSPCSCAHSRASEDTLQRATPTYDNVPMPGTTMIFLVVVPVFAGLSDYPSYL